MIMMGYLALSTPHGRTVEYHTRLDTNDGALVSGILDSDEYGLGSLDGLSGLAIDIGAHIGGVCLPLAIDHPELRIIAVEPVPENVAVLRENVALNGLTDRIEVVEAAGTRPRVKRVDVTWDYRTAGNEPEGYVRDSRYIANIYGPETSDATTRAVEATSLDRLMAGIESLALLKIDCEGCEWDVLRSRRALDIEIVIGEWHNGPRLAGLRELLPGHDITQTGGHDDVGMFRAVRR